MLLELRMFQNAVSLALNGSPLVNEQTRQRIIKIAQSMNYTLIPMLDN